MTKGLKYEDTGVYKHMLPGWIVKSWMSGSTVPKVRARELHEKEWYVKHGSSVFLLYVPEIANVNRLRTALAEYFAHPMGGKAVVSLKDNCFYIH